MEVKFTKNSKQVDIVIIDLNENTLLDRQAFKNDIQTIVDKGWKNIVLNFDDVAYVNSVVVGVIAVVIKIISEHKGKIKMVNLSSFAEEIFNIVRLDKLIDKYDSIDAAVESF